MSNSIDQRVVEMKFENEQFEKGISTSLKSLDNLKSGLDTTSAVKGLKNLSSASAAIDLSKLGSQVDYIASRFNVLGIVAQNFKNKIVESLSAIPIQIYKTIEQFTALEMAGTGFEKFGNKTRSVGTLISQGYDMSEVNEQIERLNWFADETSYSLVDMTENIAKFTASGKGLTESADAMQGIALWAALSGQQSSVATRAMYQLSQAMGSGIMRKEDYKSIQNMSMDTMEFRKHAIEAAIEIGTLERVGENQFKSLVNDVKDGVFTIEQFADHLTEDAWFTDDVMMKVYREYSAAVDQIYQYTEDHGVTASEAIKALGDTVDAFGMKAFKAGQEARTWGDVIDATKDAVSSQWMTTWELIFGDYSQAKELWTDLANELWDVFAGGGEERNIKLTEVLSSKWGDFVGEIAAAGVEQADFEEALKKSISSRGLSFQLLMDQYDSLEEVMQHIPDASGIVADALRSMSGTTTETITEATKVVTDFTDIVNRVIQGDFGNGQDRVEALTAAGYDYATIQGLVNELIYTGTMHFEDLTEEQAEAIGLSDEQAKALKDLANQAEKTGTPLNELIESLTRPSGRQLLLESFWNVFHGIIDSINAVKEAYHDIFPEKTAEQIYKTIEAVNKASKAFVLTAGKSKVLKQHFRGLFAAVDIVYQAFKALGKGMLTIVKHLLPSSKMRKGIIGFTGNLSDSIVKFDEWIKTSDFFSKKIGKAADAIGSAIDRVKEIVGKFVSKIAEYLKELPLEDYLESVSDWVKNLGTKVSDSIGKYFEDIDISEHPIVSMISGWKDTLVEVFTDAWDSLAFTFSSGSEDFSASSEEAMNTLADSFSSESMPTSVGGTFAIIADKIKEIFGSFEELWPTLKEIGAGIGRIFSAVFGTVANFAEAAKEVDPEKVESAVSLGLNFARFRLLKKFFKGVSTSLSGVAKALSSFTGKAGGLITSVKDTLGAVNGTLFATQKSIKADILLKVAKAIGILVLSLIGLSLIPSDKLKSVMLAMTILMAEFAIMAKLFTKMDFGDSLSYQKGSGFTHASSGFATMIALAALMLSLTSVVKQLGAMDPEQMLNGIMGMVMVMGGIVIALKVLQTSFSGSMTGNKGMFSFGQQTEGFLTSALVMLAMARSLKNLAVAVAEIGQLRWQDGLKGVLAVVFLMTSMAAVLSSSKISATKGIGFTAMAIAFEIIAHTIGVLGSMDKELERGIGSLTILVAVVAIMTRISGSASNIGDVGKTFLGAAIAIGILALAMKLFANQDPANIAKGLGAFAFALLELAIFANMMPSTGAGFEKTILAFAASMLILAPALKIFSTMSIGAIIVSLIAIAGSLLVFGAAAAMLTPIAGVMNKVSSAVLKLGLGVLTLAVAIPLLAAGIFLLIPALYTLLMGVKMAMPIIVDIIVELIIELGRGIVESADVLVSDLLILVDKVLDSLVEYTGPICDKLLDVCVDILESIAERIDELLRPIGKIIDAIATAIFEAIESMDWKKALTLVGAFGAFGVMLALLSGMKENLVDALIVSAGIIAVMILVATIFWALRDIDGDNMLAQAEALIAAMTAVIGVFVVITNTKVNFVSALKALGVLGTAIAGLSVLVAGLGLVYTALGDNAKKFVNGGVELFTAIGTAIGGFIGGIAGGAMAAIGAGLAAFGFALGLFAIGAAPFFAVLDSFTQARTDAMMNLATAMLMFTTAELIDGVSGLLGSEMDLGKFGEQLEALAPHLAAFASAISGVDDKDIETAAAAAGMIGAFAENAPRSGGWIEKIIGKQDLGAFGDQLAEFAPSLKTFAEKASPLSLSDVETAARAADMIFAFAKEAPNTGGLIGAIVGENDLDEFGRQLVNFAPKLRQFADEGKGLDSKAVETAAAAADMVIEFSKEVPNHGGLIAALTGDNDMGTFGEDLETFGKSLSAFSSQAVYINEAASDKAVKVTESLIELGEKAPGADTTWNLTSLGGRLGGMGYDGAEGCFGSNLQAFSEYVKACNWTKIEYAISAISSLCDEVVAIGPDGTEMIKKFGEGLGGLSQFTVDEFCENLNSATDLVEDAGQNIIDSLLAGMGGNSDGTLLENASVSSFFDNIVSDMLATISSESSMEEWESAGNDMMDRLKDGFTEKEDVFKAAISNTLTVMRVELRDGESSFKTKGEEIADKIIAGLKSRRSQMYDAGRYLVEGLIKGIKGQNREVYDAGGYAAEKAIQGLENRAEEKSPSKVTYRDGVYMAQGLINGLHDSVERVYGAGTEISSSAMDGVRSAIASISQVIDDEMDTSPVIRPVIDDSGIQNGVRGIARMFNGTGSIAMNGAASLSGRFSAKNLTLDANGNPLGNTYNFNQYNNSPKALNRLEIYRQSKNLFAQAKARVNV